VAHPLRVADGVRDCDRSALRDAEEGKSLEPNHVHHGLEVAHPALERQIGRVPVTEPAAALVIPDDRAAGGELHQERTPDRALPVVFQVAEPVGRLDQRRSFAGRRIRQTNPVGRLAEPDLLLHRRCAGRSIRRRWPDGRRFASGPANDRHDGIGRCEVERCRCECEVSLTAPELSRMSSTTPASGNHAACHRGARLADGHRRALKVLPPGNLCVTWRDQVHRRL
jgi:hypothetical protein